MFRLSRLSPALLVIALLVGGGSMAGAIGNAVLGILGAFLLPVLVALHVTGQRRFGPGLVPVAILFGGIALLGLVQLLPLGGLAERPLVDAIRDWAGVGPQPTLSLDPAATVRSLLFLLFPLAFALTLLGAGRRERHATLRAMVAMAVASSLLALLQLASGGFQSPLLVNPTDVTRGGLFANVNHQGLFQALALLAAGMMLPHEDKLDGHKRRLLAATLVGSALLAALVGGSQAGLVFVVLASLLLLRRQFGLGARQLVPGLLLFAGAAVLLGLLVPGTDQWFSSDMAESGSSRLSFWRNGAALAASQWPWGSGLGTFASAYASIEPIAEVSPRYVNHAHNDLVELSVETGAVGLLLLLGWLAILATSLVRHAERGSRRWPYVVTGLLLIAAHSLIDYPLRTASLATVAMAFLVLPFAAPGTASSRASRPLLALGIAVPLGVLAAILSAPPLLAELLYRSDRPVTALKLDADHPQSLAARATLNATEDPEAAARHARAALDAAPLQPAAAVMLLLDPDRAATADPAVLAGLGWRNSALQTYLFLEALQAGDDSTAARHLAALSRRRQLFEVLAPTVRLALLRPDLVAALEEVGGLADAREYQPVLSAPIAGDLEGQIALLEALGRNGTVPPRYTTAALRTLLDRGDGARAVDLYRALYPARPPLSLAPYEGASSRVERTPFDPVLLERGGVRAARADRNDGLRLTGRLPTRQEVAPRYLPVNADRLTFSYKIDRRRGSASVTPRIACPDGRQVEVAAPRIDADRHNFVVYLPDDCAAPRLSWEIDNAGERFDIRILESKLEANSL